MKVETEDYGAGPRILIYFMQGHAHAITVAQALELRNMLDEQIRAVELRNEAVGTVGESPPLNKHYPVELCPSCDGTETTLPELQD